MPISKWEKDIKNPDVNLGIIEKVCNEMVKKFPNRLKEQKEDECNKNLTSLLEIPKIKEELLSSRETAYKKAEEDCINILEKENLLTDKNMEDCLDAEKIKYLNSKWSNLALLYAEIKIDPPTPSDVYIPNFLSRKYGFFTYFNNIIDELQKFDEWLGYEATSQDLKYYYKPLENAIYKNLDISFSQLREYIRGERQSKGLKQLPTKKQVVSETYGYWSLPRSLELDYRNLRKDLGHNPSVKALIKNLPYLSNVLISYAKDFERVSDPITPMTFIRLIKQRLGQLISRPYGYFTTEEITKNELSVVDSVLGYKTSAEDLKKLGMYGLNRAIEKYWGGFSGVRKEMAKEGLLEVPEKRRTWTIEDVINELGELDKIKGYKATWEDSTEVKGLVSAINRFGGMKEIRKIMNFRNINTDLPSKTDFMKKKFPPTLKWTLESVINEISKLDEEKGYKIAISDAREIKGLKAAIAKFGGILRIRGIMNERGIGTDLPKKVEFIKQQKQKKKNQGE